MLVEKNTQKSRIAVLRLIGGEEIITKIVSETPEVYEIEKPMTPMATEQGLTIVPYLVMANPDKSINLNRNLIVMETEASVKNEETYERMTSKIIKASSSVIAQR